MTSSGSEDSLVLKALGTPRDVKRKPRDSEVGSEGFGDVWPLRG